MIVQACNDYSSGDEASIHLGCCLFVLSIFMHDHVVVSLVLMHNILRSPSAITVLC